jgi:hypothetical protein
MRSHEDPNVARRTERCMDLHDGMLPAPERERERERERKRERRARE